MPVILSDDILIPPSMRANRGPVKRYYEVNQTGSTTTTIIEPSSTIELPPHHHHVEHHSHGIITPPRSPLIVHQETTRIIPRSRDYDDDDDCSCCDSGEEYDYQYEGGRRRNYYAESSLEAPTRRHRSLSVGPPLAALSATEYGRHRRRHRHDQYEASEGSYYMEDGREHNNYMLGPAEHHHRGPHVLPGHRHADEPGYNEDEKHHRRTRRLAQAGLAVAAMGAAKELHDHRRARSRSRSSSRSRSNSPSHRGRNIAGAALGATVAGIAAQKLRQRRNRSRSHSADSYTSDSSNDGHNHRNIKIAAATAATIGGAALAAHQYRKRRGSRSRSRSSSRGSSPVRRERRPSQSQSHTGRHIAAAALGGTAAGLAHHHYKHHREDAQRPRPMMRRSHSEGSFRRRPGMMRRGRSPSPHKTSNLKKGAAIATAAVIAKKALDQYRDRSRSRSRSSSRERHRRRQHRQHSRSPSPNHREGMPKRVLAAMSGAAIEGARRHNGGRSRHGSISEAGRHHGGGVPLDDRRQPHHVYVPPGGPLSPSLSLHGGGYVETIDSSSRKSDSDVTSEDDRSYSSDNHKRRPRADSHGEKLANGPKHITGGRQDGRLGLGDGLSPEHLAYKLGQTLGRHNREMETDKIRR